jgi:hypothetical protein
MSNLKDQQDVREAAGVVPETVGLNSFGDCITIPQIAMERISNTYPSFRCSCPQIASF